MTVAQINSLDYWSLVNMLTYQITPEIRKLVLKRLTEMNDKLILNSDVQKSDLSKMAINHPNTLLKNNYQNQIPNKKEITVDDIIDNMIDDSPEQDELDKKLAKIKILYDKVISDKRKRRKNMKQ